MIQVFGRLHPLLVHFPIALLLAALVAELLRPRRNGPSEAGFFCLLLGTLGAVLAALAGWVFAEHDPPGMATLLLRHRWSGVGTAASALVTLYSAWRWRSGAKGLARPTRFGLGLTALLAAFSGHVGGQMVYGEDFLFEPLREREASRDDSDVEGTSSAAADALSGGKTQSTSSHPGDEPQEPPLDYLAQVLPVLERRCFECHGNRRRPKGRLRLSNMASVFARLDDEIVIVPGDPEGSMLYERIVLPAEHEDIMPPDDGPLPPDEIEIVRRWIAEGAHWVEPPSESPAEPLPEDG